MRHSTNTRGTPGTISHASLKFAWPLLGMAAALLTGGTSHAAPAPQPGSTWTIQGENDAITTTPGGSDRFYTNGLRLGWTSGTDGVPDAVAHASRVVWGDGITRISFNITQQIYTPADIRRTTPDPRDRPLAGYLAGTFSVLHDTEHSRSVVAVTVGMTGPAALGRTVQNGWHELIRIPINKGWGSQLPNEPQLQLLAERTWRVGLARAGGLETDLLPSLTAGVGTVRDYIQTGFILRLGQGLERDFGVARIRPGVTGGDAFAAAPGVAWYVFAGANGQAVARDLFLDGTLWQRSAHVRRNWFLGAMEAGVAVIWHGVRLSYTQTWQTQSFRGQRGGLFNFGSVAASVHF
jgi:lipid A 3-O-deacylase